MEVSQSPRVLGGDDPESNGAVHLKLPVMAGRTGEAGRAQLGVTTRSEWGKKEERNGRREEVEEDGKKQEEEVRKIERRNRQLWIQESCLRSSSSSSSSVPSSSTSSSFSSFAKPHGESSQEFGGKCRRVRACLW